MAVPFLWTGSEYFRCETLLLPLRLADARNRHACRVISGGRWLVEAVGAYGAGFLVTFATALLISGLYKQIFRIPLLHAHRGGCDQALILIAIMLPALSRTRMAYYAE